MTTPEQPQANLQIQVQTQAMEIQRRKSNSYVQGHTGKGAHKGQMGHSEHAQRLSRKPRGSKSDVRGSKLVHGAQMAIGVVTAGWDSDATF